MLKRWETARQLAPALGELLPDAAPDMQLFMKSEDGREEFAAIYAMLRNPGLSVFVKTGFGRGGFEFGWGYGPHVNRIDDFRENWWCAPASGNAQDGYRPPRPGYEGLGASLIFLYGSDDINISFLRQQEGAEANQEWKRIFKHGTAPNALASVAIVWVRAHPNDPEAAEALHLAVRSTRFGCRDGESTAWSHRAFSLLHRNYPESPWTKRTPYWF
jgi:hypothetical protein